MTNYKLQLTSRNISKPTNGTTAFHPASSGLLKKYGVTTMGVRTTAGAETQNYKPKQLLNVILPMSLKCHVLSRPH